MSLLRPDVCRVWHLRVFSPASLSWVWRFCWPRVVPLAIRPVHQSAHRPALFRGEYATGGDADPARLEFCTTRRRNHLAKRYNRWLHTGSETYEENDEEEVTVGTAVLNLADLGRTWVEAQVDELDATRVRLGADAMVTVEGDPGLRSRGRIVYIAPEMTARTEISADPSEPTRAQVLRVRIRTSAPAPFKLHERLEAAIETTPEKATENDEIRLLETQP